LREWPEAPGQKNLAGVVERLQVIRKLGVGQDREQRIHRARYSAIARETAILSAQHLSRFDTQRRLATLVVFAREMSCQVICLVWQYPATKARSKEHRKLALVRLREMLGGRFLRGLVLLKRTR
jgi:hypothetical protein